jgi:hypothetical protein
VSSRIEKYFEMFCLVLDVIRNSSFSPLLWRGARGEVMAYPARLVFTPFVVVVGGKYFLPVPECLIF